MPVLVWNSGGNTKVYAADTAAQIEHIVHTIIACAEDLEINAKISLVQKHMAKHPGNAVEMLSAFNTIRNAVIGTGDELFTELSMTTVIDECN